MTEGATPCTSGHEAPPGASFCSRCGSALGPNATFAPPASSVPAGDPYATPGYPPAVGPAGHSPYGWPGYAGAPYPAGHPAPGGPYGYVSAPAKSPGINGMAIASMVLGICWVYWVGSILALVFGYTAMRQIKERNESGRGMALAGIILGWVGVGIGAVVIVIVIVAAATSSGS